MPWPERHSRRTPTAQRPSDVACGRRQSCVSTATAGERERERGTVCAPATSAEATSSRPRGSEEISSASSLVTCPAARRTKLRGQGARENGRGQASTSLWSSPPLLAPRPRTRPHGRPDESTVVGDRRRTVPPARIAAPRPPSGPQAAPKRPPSSPPKGERCVWVPSSRRPWRLRDGETRRAGPTGVKESGARQLRVPVPRARGTPAALPRRPPRAKRRRSGQQPRACGRLKASQDGRRAPAAPRRAS